MRLRRLEPRKTPHSYHFVIIKPAFWVQIFEALPLAGRVIANQW
jgi:hypothetical protein